MKWLYSTLLLLVLFSVSLFANSFSVANAAAAALGLGASSLGSAQQSAQQGAAQGNQAAGTGISAAQNALYLSFGGPIIAMYPKCLNGAIWIAITPYGGDLNPFYIWTPATITFMAGPPTHIGEQVLGLATNVPYQCVVSYYPYIALTGQPMFTLGTSGL